MRPKLKVFSEFASKLLPHEAEYLMSVQQLIDPVKLEILNSVSQNARNLHQQVAYDPALDKRKYSHLKNWIEKRLKEVDVDEHFAWMSDLERKINWDSISPLEEKKLLKSIRNYSHPIFNFAKFYDLVRQYRQFLLIRLRYDDHQFVNRFLSEHQSAYQRTMLVGEQIHQATQDIIRHSLENSNESIQWEKWLIDTFYDENLDGFNRYMAFIRLLFIAFNYNRYDYIQAMFDYLDIEFSKGKYYSKRILLNYYNNRLLFHTRLGDSETGVYYGYLSIREKNNDYLLYVNNLCNVLLQTGKTEETWNILRQALPYLKTTHNYHSRIGFVALYIKTLVMKKEYIKAHAYGELNLNAYEKEILHYRWHRFFSAYLECLLILHKNLELIRLVKKYGLLEKEKQYKSRSNYLPSIAWYSLLAKYQLGELNIPELIKKFQENFSNKSKPDIAIYQSLMQRLKDRFPLLYKDLMEQLTRVSKKG